MEDLPTFCGASLCIGNRGYWIVDRCVHESLVSANHCSYFWSYRSNGKVFACNYRGIDARISCRNSFATHRFLERFERRENLGGKKGSFVVAFHTTNTNQGFGTRISSREFSLCRFHDGCNPRRGSIGNEKNDFFVAFLATGASYGFCTLDEFFARENRRQRSMNTSEVETSTGLEYDLSGILPSKNGMTHDFDTSVFMSMIRF